MRADYEHRIGREDPNRGHLRNGKRLSGPPVVLVSHDTRLGNCEGALLTV